VVKRQDKGADQMVDWEKQLAKYEGYPIKIWIEDRSGEEQTQPKQAALYKVQISDDQAYVQFYLTPTQFISVPIFDGNQTRMESDSFEERFVSHDLQEQLLYWIYFKKHRLEEEKR
jgi:uncharacterized membrane protein